MMILFDLSHHFQGAISGLYWIFPFQSPLIFPYHLWPILPSSQSQTSCHWGHWYIISSNLRLCVLSSYVSINSTIYMIYKHGHWRVLRQGMLLLHSATTVIGPWVSGILHWTESACHWGHWYIISSNLRLCVLSSYVSINSTIYMIYKHGHWRVLRQGMLLLHSATTVIGPWVSGILHWTESAIPCSGLKYSK